MSSSPTSSPRSRAVSRVARDRPVKTAVTTARLCPVRMSSRLTRPPRMALRASMMMDFPAPVSPESTERPG